MRIQMIAKNFMVQGRAVLDLHDCGGLSIEQTVPKML
jgi:hypothetical protein